ncbi:hypothetical protein [Haloarcula onubensis]|uniref:Uncharacterized protein n=1 Tax=Haloarcula onubensis TaxID=2950539 RepID=A0ABU2FR01_9EURY|nr:hypothetical protein [Halomicroarcula sp. S3CR25-11]MDS0283190.1 hypothetical protein [Halomicroarcula sp. S3CR25-11]
MKNVAIGGVLLFLSFLFVPTFFVLGYVVRSLRYVLDGIEEPRSSTSGATCSWTD